MVCCGSCTLQINTYNTNCFEKVEEKAGYPPFFVLKLRKFVVIEQNIVLSLLKSHS